MYSLHLCILNNRNGILQFYIWNNVIYLTLNQLKMNIFTTELSPADYIGIVAMATTVKVKAVQTLKASNIWKWF